MQVKFILKTLFLINCINIIYANEDQIPNNQAIINNYNASDDYDAEDEQYHQNTYHSQSAYNQSEIISNNQDNKTKNTIQAQHNNSQNDSTINAEYITSESAHNLAKTTVVTNNSTQKSISNVNNSKTSNKSQNVITNNKDYNNNQNNENNNYNLENHTPNEMHGEQENLEAKIKLLEKNNALLKQEITQLENKILNNTSINNSSIITEQIQTSAINQTKQSNINIEMQNEEQFFDINNNAQLINDDIIINKEYSQEYSEEIEFNIIKSTNNPQEDYNLLVAQFKEIYLEKDPNSKEKNILILQNNLFNFISDHEKSNLMPNVHYWLAESFSMLSNFSKASFHYLKSFSIYKQLQKENNINKNLSVNLPEVLLKLAESLVKLNKEKEALSIINKLKTEFPNDTKNLQVRVNAVINNIKNISKDNKNNKENSANKKENNSSNKAPNKPNINTNKLK